MKVVIAPRHPLTGRFDELDGWRDEFHAYYARLLDADPRMRGHVLDVGCGVDLPKVDELREVLLRCRRLDGVDPTPGVADHPHLTERWCGPFEEAAIPEGAYDAIFTFWVAEHLRSARDFMRKAHAVLRPGGVLYALTPNALHPFAVISRTVNALNLKERWRKSTSRYINAYPAYYRINRRGRVVRAARDAGFLAAEFHHVPCVQWDTYFPRPLRVLPHLYDRLLGTRVPRAAQIFVYKLER